MIEIGINNISKNFGYKNILHNLNLEIMTGDHIAIVGRNGTGKSTLLKIISGNEDVDKGTVSIRKGAIIGMLEQIPKLYQTNATTKQVLMNAFSSLLEIKQQMEHLESLLAIETDAVKLQQLLDKYSATQNNFIALHGYDMEENLNRIINGFNFQNLLDKPFNILSGGQKTIVNLAVTILKQPDILLLDEPTNHLDIKTLEWFENFLNKYKGTVVIVSHDRYFLDKVVTKTVLLDMGNCTTFLGNYSFSIKEQEHLLLLDFEQYKNQQKKISAMKDAIKRFRQWGTQADNPKFFKKAKELEKRLEKIDTLDKPQIDKPKIPISFSGERSGKEVLRLEKFSLSFGETLLFDNAELLILEKERVCFIGDNGTGKTSLIRAILGENKHYFGKITFSPSIKSGYIPQEIRFDCDNDSVLDAFRKEYNSTEGEARNILAKFFFYGENIFKQVGLLSGGEKVLLKLAILIQNKTNFLIMDEPTNHIDIETREILEEALLEFKGTLFCISHDRYFINKISTRTVELIDHRIDSASQYLYSF